MKILKQDGLLAVSVSGGLVADGGLLRGAKSNCQERQRENRGMDMLSHASVGRILYLERKRKKSKQRVAVPFDQRDEDPTKSGQTAPGYESEREEFQTAV